MLCKAASGGLLSRKAPCREVPSICPTASIPRPDGRAGRGSEGRRRAPLFKAGVRWGRVIGKGGE